MGWLITLGILVLLAVVPLGASAVYNSEGFFAYLIAGPLRIKLFPVRKNSGNKKDKHKSKEKKSPSASAEKKKQPKSEKNNNGGSVADFLPLLKIGLALLNDFRRKLRVNRLDVKVILAGGDPCDLAVNYGKTWTAVGNLMPHLERFLVIKQRDIQVECDFVAGSTLIFAHVNLTITLGRIVYIAVYHGVRAVVAYLRIMNKRKGGAKV